MIVHNGNIVVNNGRWIIPERMKYKVNLIQTEGGTISAVPVTGINGVTVTLSNTPNQYYTFNGYTVNGATLYGGNKFDFDNSDVTVSASFNYYNPYNPLNLPPNTVRVRTSDGNVPLKYSSETRYETATLVPGTSDVYDVYKSGTNFGSLLNHSTNVIEVLGANTSNITLMGGMFYQCSALQSVALFDTSNVTDMDGMFRGCSSLTNVPLFDTSKVTNMRWMLYNCKALQSVPLFDTSKVTNMEYMLYRCEALQSVPLFNTSNVVIMASMFDHCTSLKSVPLFDTSKVTNMNGTFRNCYALQSVPLFNTSNVTNMGGMFAYCSSLQFVPLLDTSKVTYMTFMFQECTNVQSGALALYQQASTQANPPSSHDGTFKYCGSNTTTGAAELAQIPANWK